MRTYQMLLSMMLAIGLSACGDVVVISSDGTEQVGYCSGALLGNPPICLQKLCLNGSIALKDAEKHGGDVIVRCLPRADGAK